VVAAGGEEEPMSTGRIRLIAAGVGVVLAAGLVAAAAVAVDRARSRPVVSRQVDHAFDGVARVVLRIDEGSVRVTGASAGARATVGTRLRWNTVAEPHYEARLDGDALVVRAEGCEGRHFRSTCAADVELTVPADARLDLTVDAAGVEVAGVRGPVRIGIDSGDLTATGLASPTVDVAVDSGDVRLEFTAPPTDVRTRTDSSDVVILVPAGSGPYAVRTRTDSGTARVEVSTTDNPSRRISASNDTGDIRVGYAGPPAMTASPEPASTSTVRSSVQ
jgi:hypothetical protein